MASEFKEKLILDQLSELDIKTIDEAFQLENYDELEQYIYAYLKHFGWPKYTNAIAMAIKSDRPYFVASVLKACSYRGYHEADYEALVLHCLDWPYEDWSQEIEIIAIHRLPKHFKLDDKIRQILRQKLKSNDPFVRDTVAEALQEYAGTDILEIYRTDGSGNLFNLLDKKIQALIL